MKKVTGLYQENVEMREYYTLNGKGYDTLADILVVMRPHDTAESRRTVYWPDGDKDTSLGERSYKQMWRTYVGSSLVDMRVTMNTATSEMINNLPLANLYDGELPELFIRG